ncbi:uncharacterized protein TM35_000352050 [Trypanosoma theileri]|uniref:Uncharacterized protein n=1 Tax=Trypanosoma theileri TaxID=67003 RepID=A0A1X0NLL6_9TRYP|nr:uncharacterized protein TM35_000352050 [Trypanosoma theileri]ORC85461.1 hypothetical protein TM35_000352050 [Trypanosoma theileri]
MSSVNETSEVVGSTTDSLWLIIGLTGAGLLILILIAVIVGTYYCLVRRRQRTGSNRFLQQTRYHSRDNSRPTTPRGSVSYQIPPSQKGLRRQGSMGVENNSNVFLAPNMGPGSAQRQLSASRKCSQQQPGNYYSANEQPQNGWPNYVPQGYGAVPQQLPNDQWAMNGPYAYPNPLHERGIYQNDNDNSENVVPMQIVPPAQPPVSQQQHQDDDDESQPRLQRRNSRVSFVGVFEV